VRLLATLKQVKVTNSDTDSYVTITFEANNDFDMNLLNDMRHKALVVEIDEDA